MDELKYALLMEVVGRWKADVIENLLKSEEIDVVVVQESVSDLFTTTFSPVKIYVPNACLGLARELLKMLEEEEEDNP
jgi:hypothetical protein